MAEVLYPLSPQLQTRPSSSDNFKNGMSGQQQQQHSQQPRLVQMPRHNYNTSSGGPGYRGTATAPTYAFKATPNLKNGGRSPSQQTNQQTSPPAPQVSSSDSKLNSAWQQPTPVQPQAQENKTAGNRQRYPTPSSVSTNSSSSSSTTPTWSQQLFSKDDTLNSNFQLAPFTTQSSSLVNNSTPTSASPPSMTDASNKQSPDRYRRGNKRVENSTNTQSGQANNADASSANSPGMSKMGQFSYTPPATGFQQQKSSTLSRTDSATSDTPATDSASSSDAASNNRSMETTSMSRYRRKGSLGVNNADNNSKPAASGTSGDARPASAAAATNTPPKPFSSNPNGPARTFAEVARRTNNPSPLSRPMTPNEASSPKADEPSSPSAGPSVSSNNAFHNSPAVAAMAALNDRDPQKGVKSRLRRAFSFGSSAELRRAAGETDTAADRARARKEQFSNELDEEQDLIAQQQEASGLGNNIYSGQAGFTGSTDNLSISSTASSASMMLRKMGKGMKKGGRSIKGIFRPKSVVGVPPPDSPLEASVGPISMVTVEAEREKVNVNVDPHDQAGGGTGFPRLEKNSLDVARTSQSNGDARDGSKESRRSIVGGENDRAEVLAAVKRGILKRTGTSSTANSPSAKPSDASITQHENSSVERHGSPVPSTASSEPRRNGHRRTDSVALENDDYFTVPRLVSPSTRSLPDTPRNIARNISFSPRIQFHDVWSSQDYDRRGDIATCNRLTPMLAQQIKEELNTFKMEMEVHEMSKPHTHFF